MPLNVLPCLATHDSGDVDRGDAVRPRECGQTLASRISGSNRQDIGGRKLRGIDGLAALEALRSSPGRIAIASARAALGHHVGTVLGRSPDKQVVRVHTRRVVTLVTHVPIRFYGAAQEKPCPNVGTRSPAVEPKDPVPGIPPAASAPGPAFTTGPFLNLGPKPFNGTQCSANGVASIVKGYDNCQVVEVCR